MTNSAISNFAELFSGVGILLGAGTLMLGVVNARRQAKFERMERQAAALQLFNQRYQEVMQERRALTAREVGENPATAAEVKWYYERYWSVQIDAWEHFRLGVLSRPTYATWLMYVYDIARERRSAFRNGSPDLWISVGRGMSRNNIAFASLLVEVFELGTASASADVAEQDWKARAILLRKLESLAMRAVRGALPLPRNAPSMKPA